MFACKFLVKSELQNQKLGSNYQDFESICVIISIASKLALIAPSTVLELL